MNSTDSVLESFMILWKDMIDLVVLCIILHFISKAEHAVHSILTPWGRVLLLFRSRLCHYSVGGAW
jgi:hypothetical protein